MHDIGTNLIQISIKLILEGGVSELRQMIKCCKDELGLCATMAVEYKDPICRRIDTFLDHADVKILEVEKRASDVFEKVANVRQLFGENASANSGECISSTFFSPLCDFAAKYSKAHKENMKLRTLVRTILIGFYAMCFKLFLTLFIERSFVLKTQFKVAYLF